MSNFGPNLISKIYEKYHSNPGNMLIHTGIIGWVMSSLAQITAIVVNDKIPKEQKMFMIPQEFADAVINILSFYLVTRTFTSVAKKLVNQGKWISKPIFDFLKKNNLTSEIGKPSFDVLTHANLTPELRKKFFKWRNGVDVGATLAGSVLSCNIITPLLRNVYASTRQQNSIARMNDKYDKKNREFVNSYFRPTMATFQGNASIYPTGTNLKV